VFEKWRDFLRAAWGHCGSGFGSNALPERFPTRFTSARQQHPRDNSKGDGTF
jgi:hypothetical protein